MRRSTADNLISAALRDLDPAPQTRLSTAEQERADAIFARIVATRPEGSVPQVPGRPRQSRRRLLMTAGIGLVGVAGVAVPVLLLGGGSAYATWTPDPVAITGTAASDAGTTCRSTIGAPDRGERVVVAERRGGWAFVLLVGKESQVVCLMPDNAVGKPEAASDDFFGASDAGTARPPALSSDELVRGAAMSSSTAEGWFTWATGYIGKDVTGVTVDTSSGLHVKASIAGDRFAAWWPGDGQQWSYTLHLSDGTTRRVD